MLRLFLRVVLAFAALVALFLLIGALLPRGYDIESRVLIDAPVEKVFPLVNELKNWEHWSPVSESRIDGLSAEYSGPISGDGAIQTWTESRGDGKMWITTSQPEQSIEYQWRFSGFPDLTGRFKFESVVEGDRQQTQVAWQSSGKLPAGPFYGYFGMIFESAITDEYQKCLQRLKTFAEKK